MDEVSALERTEEERFRQAREEIELGLECSGAWKRVADEPVCATLDTFHRNASEAEGKEHHPFTVRQVAFLALHALHTSGTVQSAMEVLTGMAHGFLRGKPSPDNPDNR